MISLIFRHAVLGHKGVVVHFVALTVVPSMCVCVCVSQSHVGPYKLDVVGLFLVWMNRLCYLYRQVISFCLIRGMRFSVEIYARPLIVVNCFDFSRTLRGVKTKVYCLNLGSW